MGEPTHGRYDDPQWLLMFVSVYPNLGGGLGVISSVRLELIVPLSPSLPLLFSLLLLAVCCPLPPSPPLGSGRVVHGIDTKSVVSWQDCYHVFVDNESARAGQTVRDGSHQKELPPARSQGEGSGWHSDAEREEQVGPADARLADEDWGPANRADG